MPELVQAFVTALKLIFTGDPEVFDITARSLVVSCTSTLLASLIFTPAGSLIYFHSFPGKRALVSIIQTLFSLPTVFVGLLVFITFSRAGPLGELQFLFTKKAMVIGQVALISPIVMGLTISALSGVGQEVRDTAISLGASRLWTILTMMREARYAIATALLVSFGRAISEVGCALMVGGNIVGRTRVLTTTMSLETSMGNIELSMALGIILMAIALAVSVLVNRFQQR